MRTSWRDHRHYEYLARLADHRREKGGLTSKQAELAQEATLAVDGDHMLLATISCHRRHFSFQDHEEVVTPVALSEEHLSLLHAPRSTVPGERPYLRVAQPRKRSVSVRRFSAMHLPAGVRGCHYPDNPQPTTCSIVAVSLA
jgi:hypothetical protein